MRYPLEGYTASLHEACETGKASDAETIALAIHSLADAEEGLRRDLCFGHHDPSGSSGAPGVLEFIGMQLRDGVSVIGTVDITGDITGDIYTDTKDAK